MAAKNLQGTTHEHSIETRHSDVHLKLLWYLCVDTLLYQEERPVYQLAFQAGPTIDCFSDRDFVWVGSFVAIASGWNCGFFGERPVFVGSNCSMRLLHYSGL